MEERTGMGRKQGSEWETWAMTAREWKERMGWGTQRSFANCRRRNVTCIACGSQQQHNGTTFLSVPSDWEDPFQDDLIFVWWD